MGLDFNSAAFERALRTEAERHVRAGMARLAPWVRGQVMDVLDGIVKASPEYASLLGGDLQNLFGIADPGPAVANIASAFARSVHVTPTPASGTSLGGMVVQILREDLSDVLGVDGGSYVSHSVIRNTETLVPWLEWLLLVGDRIVVTDFEVHTARGGYTGTRTGRAVMVRPTRRASRGFRVPAEFSGTVDSNWLTRCVGEAVGPVYEILQRAVESL